MIKAANGTDLREATGVPKPPGKVQERGCTAWVGNGPAALMPVFIFSFVWFSLDFSIVSGPGSYSHYFSNLQRCYINIQFVIFRIFHHTV